MTIEEIKNKINAAIRGQGTNIDAGGALADVLDGIIELSRGVVEINDLKGSVSKEQFEQLLQAYAIVYDGKTYVNTIVPTSLDDGEYTYYKFWGIITYNGGQDNYNGLGLLYDEVDGMVRLEKYGEWPVYPVQE